MGNTEQTFWSLFFTLCLFFKNSNIWKNVTYVKVVGSANNNQGSLNNNNNNYDIRFLFSTLNVIANTERLSLLQENVHVYTEKLDSM